MNPLVLILMGSDSDWPVMSEARQALAELGIDDVPVCGLAKRLEEVWLLSLIHI